MNFFQLGHFPTRLFFVVFQLVPFTNKWSPEMIVGRYEKEHGNTFTISVSSIYRYAAAGLFQLSQKAFVKQEGIF